MSREDNEIVTAPMLCSSGRALVYKKKYTKISYNAELVADPEAGGG